jgi:type IV pilus assembly protein PilQ
MGSAQRSIRIRTRRRLTNRLPRLFCGAIMFVLMTVFGGASIGAEVVASESLAVEILPPEASVTQPVDDFAGEPRASGSWPRIRQATFFQADDVVGIRLEATGELTWRSVSARPGQIRILLPDAVIQTAVARLHQLHAFGHPVKTGLLRNTVDGGELILTATGPVVIEPEEVPEGLILRFVDAPARTEDAKPSAVPTARPESRERPVLDAFGTRFTEVEALFPGMREEYVGTPISIDLQNAEVEHVLRLIGEVAGYNLILDAGVGGRISMKLDNVPWDQVLDLVLVQRNLDMERRGNIMRISTVQQMESEREQRRRAQEAAMQAQETIERLEPLQTAYIQVNYATAAEMDARARPFLSDRGRLSFDPRTNTLILTDSPLRIRQIQGIIDRLDQPERQVMIEARVVYASDEFQRAIGLRWGGGIEGVTTEYYRGVYGAAGGGIPINQGGVGQTGYLVNTPIAMPPSFGIGGFISKLMGPDMFTLDVQLQLGELQGESRTVSSPRIVTLNNSRAVIKQGTRVRVNVLDDAGNPQPDFEDAVLELSVTPQITPDDQLILDLIVKDDVPIGENIDTKSAEAKLIVNNGETIVLGGVFKAAEGQRENRVPGLASIPGLGALFKSRITEERKEELLIFIRPSIL